MTSGGEFLVGLSGTYGENKKSSSLQGSPWAHQVWSLHLPIPVYGPPSSGLGESTSKADAIFRSNQCTPQPPLTCYPMIKASSLLHQPQVLPSHRLDIPGQVPGQHLHLVTGTSPETGEELQNQVCQNIDPFQRFQKPFFCSEFWTFSAPESEILSTFSEFLKVVVKD